MGRGCSCARRPGARGSTSGAGSALLRACTLAAAVGLILILFAPWASATAQLVGDAPPPSTTECQAATQTLTTGAPAAPDSQLRAVSIGSRCGASGLRAIAASWRLSKAAPYSDDLGYRFRMLARDSALFGAATQLAQDASASVAVRVLSLRGLMSVIDIGVRDAGYGDLTGTPPGRGCMLIPVPVIAPYAGSTLPSNYVTQIKNIATSLEGNTSEAPEIRSAANCVMNTWRRVAGYPEVALGSLNRSAITVAHVCGTRWSVRNANDVGVTVEWRVFIVGGKSGSIFLPPRPSGQPYSAQTVESPDQVNGGLSLYLDGTLLLSVIVASRTSCP